MALEFYPYYQHAAGLYKGLSGSVGGILEGSYYEAPLLRGKAQMNTVSGEIPNYHRLLFNNQNVSIDYHLSGYGLSKHEALTRLAGESVERYASLMAESLYQEQIQRCTLKELRSSGAETIAPELLNSHSEEQRQQLGQRLQRDCQAVDEHTQLDWSPCSSLYHPERTIWVPAQLLYTSAIEKDPFIAVSVSTGTAAHRSIAAALLNGLLEYLQIHSFNLIWYANRHASRITGRNPLLEQLFARYTLEEDYQLYSFDCSLFPPPLPPVVTTVLQHKGGGEPHLLCGIQCEFDLGKAMLRSALEAHAIVYSGLYKGIEGINLDTASWPLENFADLDANVMHFCNAQLAQRNWPLFAQFDQQQVSFEQLQQRYLSLAGLPSAEAQLRLLLPALAQLAPQACYQVITPPELAEQGWYVLRTFLPEFLPICLPGYPQIQHPAYHQWAKGVVNYAPHPLP